MPTLRARGGLRLQLRSDITGHPRIDVLIIPGGVVTAELKRDDIIQRIAHMAATAELTASVCSGAFLMTKAGLPAAGPSHTHPLGGH